VGAARRIALGGRESVAEPLDQHLATLGMAHRLGHAVQSLLYIDGPDAAERFAATVAASETAQTTPAARPPR
jgi:hypothetical protein